MIELIIYDRIESKLQNFKTTITEIIKGKWKQVEKDSCVFKYSVDNLKDKYVGKYFVQLNPERGSKRRTAEDIGDICQPFNPEKFNFTKVSNSEILFSMKCQQNDNTSTFIVNVSPINKYNTLLCPSVEKCLPQIITLDSLILVMDVMYLAQDRSLKIGFNSLCGYASVNHLHYHLVFNDSTFPVETMTCTQLKGPLLVSNDFPIPKFCFELKNQEEIVSTASNVYKLVNFLIKENIAHNLIFTFCEGTAERVLRVVVWPRRNSTGVKQYSGFNAGVFELCGWITVFDQQEFDRISVQEIESELNNWTIDDFEGLCNKLCRIF